LAIHAWGLIWALFGTGPASFVWTQLDARRWEARQLPHDRRGIRTRHELRHQLLDLALRLVDGPLEERLPVLQREVRSQLLARMASRKLSRGK